MMSTPTLVTWLIWSLGVLYVENAEADTRLPCPSVQRDFYPGVAPQDSPPPYVLNVTDKDGQPLYDLRYQTGDATHLISLSGQQTGNKTETFVGFILNVYNEFEDEPSGHFMAPLPQGVKKAECHYKNRSFMNEVVMNSTGKEWTDLQIQWKSSKEYPAGKIHISGNKRRGPTYVARMGNRNLKIWIADSSGGTPKNEWAYSDCARASVIKEYGVYWDEIGVTLNFWCPKTGCRPEICPHGFVTTKFGCITCECAGVAAITVQFASLILSVFALNYSFM